MNQNTGKFTGAGGCQLYYKSWEPDEKPTAKLIIVHGAGEHIDRYENLVNVLPGLGYVVVGYDQRGHGRSEGQRGHINAWEEYRGDLKYFVEEANQMYPEIPTFILGHSLGSLIVLDYIIHHADGIKGAIISGTALVPKDAAPPSLVFIAKVLSNIYPRFPLKVPLPGSSLSRDPEVARNYDEDPLVHLSRSARWATESLKVIDRIDSNLNKISMPILFVHGEQDPLVEFEGAQKCFDRIKSEDKTIYIYPENLHETHNDLDHLKVVADITSWLGNH